MIISVLSSLIESVPAWLIWTLFILSASYLYLNWQPNYWKAHGVPSVNIGLLKLIWVFGRKIPPHEYDQMMYNSIDKKCKLYGTFEIGHPACLLLDADLIKDVLIKDFNYFTDRRDLSALTGKMRIFSRMLSVLPGEEWKTTRNLMTPAFSSGKIKRMMSLMSESAEMMMGNIVRAMENNPKIDVKKTFRAFTWDVIASCAFSTKVNTEQDPNSDFATHTRNMIDKDFKILNLILMVVAPKLADKLNMTFFDYSSTQYYTRLAEEMISRRKTNPELQKRTDFLQLLLDAEKNDICSTDDDKKKVMSNELITAQAIQFFFAGSDTVASTLTFVPYFLALNPECQTKLITELDSILRKHNNEVTYEALQEMYYMDMVISESMRLYPATHRVERTCTKDHHIGDVPIKKGTIVSIPIYCLQRDPEYFQDPLKFDPERFTAENKSQINPFIYMPFGMGPRNCIGNRFALLEVKMALSYFFREFTVAVCDQTPKKLTFWMSFGPGAIKSPIILALKQRQEKFA